VLLEIERQIEATQLEVRAREVPDPVDRPLHVLGGLVETAPPEERHPPVEPRPGGVGTLLEDRVEAAANLVETAE
jgi:hypothetical protein